MNQLPQYLTLTQNHNGFIPKDEPTKDEQPILFTVLAVEDIQEYLDECV